MEIKTINKDNYSDVASIYAEGIDTGMATFETTIPSWDKWDTSHLPYARIAGYEYDQMLGWAALSPVSDRCVYGGVAEVSIYVGRTSRGKGIGQKLLNTLIEVSEKKGIWTLQAGVFKENGSSIALHEKCGFRVIGFREKVGKLNGQWFDNILLERRSKKVGVE